MYTEEPELASLPGPLELLGIEEMRQTAPNWCDWM